MPTETIPATLVVPLISSRVAGPLGIRHLPRLWLKYRLHAVGKLPEGYRCGEGGSDGEILGLLGIESETMRAYVNDDAPNYPAFEAWVRTHAKSVTPPTLPDINARFETFVMPEPRRSTWTERFGLPTYDVAARLNELDDWDLTHGQIVAPDAPSTPVIPAISTSVTGPLCVAHLPRLWLKKLLHLVGRLPADYRHGVGGFDEMLLVAIGVDNDAFDAFVRDERPGYLATETWVRANASSLTPERVAEHNAKMLVHQPPADRIAPRQAHLGVDASVTGAVALNDLDDWQQLHEQLLA